MVLILTKYTKPIEAIDAILVEHRKFTREANETGKFIFNGPFKTRTGGVAITNMSVEEAREFVKGDPFYTYQVAESEFIEFTPISYDDRFSCFIDK